MAERLRTLAAMAKAFGVHERTVSKWRAQGCPAPPTTRAKVEAWRTERTQQKAAARQPRTDPAGELADTRREDSQWTTQYRRAKALQAMLDLQERRRELIPRGEIAKLWAARALELKQSLMLVSRTVSARLPQCCRANARRLFDEQLQRLLEQYARPGAEQPEPAAAAVADDDEGRET